MKTNGNSDQSSLRDDGGEKKEQNAPPRKDTPIEQAEMRTEQANTRTDEANTRTDQANARTAEANVRTNQAELRTKKAEAQTEALRVSELSYRRLFESARDGILILNADTGRIIDVNDFLVEMLGYSRDEIVGRTVGELSPLKDILSNQAVLERLQKIGYIRYEDLPLETRDGRRIAVEFVSNRYQVGDVKVIQCNIRDITEHKRTEVAMFASEARYRRLFEAAKDGILILNAATGRIVDANPFLTELLGYAHEVFIGKHLWELGFFKDIAANEANFKELQANDCVRFDDLPLETSDGRRINVEFVSNAYMVDHYRVMQCNIRDLTERKRAEEARRGSDEQFRAMFETASIGMAQADPRTGQWLRVNQKMCAITGYSADEMLRLSVQDLTHPDDRQADWKAFQRVVRGETPDYRMEKRYLCKNGSVAWVNVNMTVIRDASDQPVRTMATIEDITERKEAEESHARLAMAVEQATETIVLTDTNGTIIYVNPAFEKTSGHTREEALGQNPCILKSGKQDAEFYRQMWEVLGRGEVWHGHFINKCKDGKLYEEEATISPVRDATGKVVNYVAVKRDVTREVQLESQFRQSQKMEAFGQLAGGVAHDFNNILAIISMQSGIMGNDKDITPQQSEIVGEMDSAVQRAADLTRQLLLFSRRQTMQPRDLELNEVITNTSKMLRRILVETVSMELKFAPQPLFVHADAGMIDQIMMNLTVNARDAMPEGGQIIIETSAVEFDELAASQSSLLARPGLFACLSVSDNGHGISPENQRRIFEPFFTTKEVGKGSGLGLATVFGIVQQHQGWISVHSEIGQGTTFRVYLPRLTQCDLLETARPAQASVRGGNETILLVEDDPTLLNSLRTALSLLGYRVLDASTAAAALEVWKQHRDEISLLLTDLVMPGKMTGKALGQRLLQENPKLKVVYVSGYSGELVGEDFPLEEGVNFLSKPFQAHKLARIIRGSMDKAA